MNRFQQAGSVDELQATFVVVLRLLPVRFCFAQETKTLFDFLAFRLNRLVRASHRPRYISFYEPKVNTPEVIVTTKDAQQWAMEKHRHKDFCSPIPSLSISNKEQYPFIHMSPRRAGCEIISNFVLSFLRFCLKLF